MVMDRDPTAGGETPVVLLHPVNLTARCWMPVASRLEDFNRVLIDNRGHGRSHMNGPFRIDDYAADVRAVIEALGLRAIHIVGASLGASIACAVAAALPGTVKSLVAVGASLEPADPDSLARLERWREAGAAADLFDVFIGQEVSHGLSPAAAADARQQVGLNSRREELIKDITWNAFAEDARRHAAGVRCPALVLTGEHDESCPPATGERMAAALGAPFEILPGLGHLPMMQAPSLVAERLAGFISGVTTQ
jgi:pimeloyl-ACP methyl ester carboxylesterase